ncbi:MAG: rhomboid family intramembrane serine protease [Planctomycetota bacterium]|jgi:membrane associated rhomboid family serine protease
MLILPLGDENPASRKPYVTWAIIALNGLVFLALNLLRGQEGSVTEISQADALAYGLVPADPTPWAFLSCQFVHANLLHLVGNMWFLHIFGDNVEDKMGRLSFLGFYLLGGIVASVAFLLFGSTIVSALGARGGDLAEVWQQVPLVGASGAIAAVTGAYIVFFPKARIRVLWWLIFVGFSSFPAILVVGMFFLKDLISAAIVGSSMLGGAAHVGGVAYAAHVGGTVMGIVVAFLLKPRLRARGGSPWDKDTGFSKRVSEDTDSGEWSAGWDGPRTMPSKDLRDQLVGAVLDQRMELALDLYGKWKAQPRHKVLPPGVEIEIAHEIVRRGDIHGALDAYRSYLGRHPVAPDAAEAKFRLGLLHARATGEHRRAREWLLQAIQEHGNPATVEYAKRELAELDRR